MNFDINTILMLVVGAFLGLLAWTVNAQKKAIEESLKELGKQISKLEIAMGKYQPISVCDIYHNTHAEKHQQIKDDINGIGRRVDEAVKRVEELERGAS